MDICVYVCISSVEVNVMLDLDTLFSIEGLVPSDPLESYFQKC